MEYALPALQNGLCVQIDIQCVSIVKESQTMIYTSWFRNETFLIFAYYMYMMEYWMNNMYLRNMRNIISLLLLLEVCTVFRYHIYVVYFHLPFLSTLYRFCSYENKHIWWKTTLPQAWLNFSAFRSVNLNVQGNWNSKRLVGVFEACVMKAYNSKRFGFRFLRKHCGIPTSHILLWQL